MKRHAIEEKFFIVVMIASTVVVVGALGLILLTIAVKGFSALSLGMLFKLPQGGYCTGSQGGILNAIIGSLTLGIVSTILAAIVSIPVAVYLNMYLKNGSPLGTFIRFMLDLLWGIPSIVYGAFGFTLMIFFHLPASLLAGILTITLLIIPIMARSMDEVLKGLPPELATASYCLGATRLETALKVVLRLAFPGLLTAILIAFGRGIGAFYREFFRLSSRLAS
jgi:phosphate transport system permease protein